MAALSVNDALVVLGRQGNWLQTVFQGKTGWIQAGYVRILGIASTSPSVQEPEIPQENAITLPASPPSRRSPPARPRSPRKHPLGASVHFAKGIKSMEDAARFQLSAGMVSWGKSSGLDFFLGVGVKGATLFYGGPPVVPEVGIPGLGGRLHFLTSLPVYSFSQDGEHDLAIGTQSGLELRFPIRRGSARLNLTLPFEAILYGANRTRISVLPGLGIVF